MASWQSLTAVDVGRWLLMVGVGRAGGDYQVAGRMDVGVKYQRELSDPFIFVRFTVRGQVIRPLLHRNTLSMTHGKACCMLSYHYDRATYSKVHFTIQLCWLLLVEGWSNASLHIISGFTKNSVYLHKIARVANLGLSQSNTCTDVTRVQWSPYRQGEGISFQNYHANIHSGPTSTCYQPEPCMSPYTALLSALYCSRKILLQS